MLCGEMGERGGIGLLADCIRQGGGGAVNKGRWGWWWPLQKGMGGGKRRQRAVGMEGGPREGRCEMWGEALTQRGVQGEGDIDKEEGEWGVSM